jgi:hypothetical protein
MTLPMVAGSIKEDGGLNVYDFCGGDPINCWDYLGLEILCAEGEFYKEEVKYALERISEAKLKWVKVESYTNLRHIDESKLWKLEIVKEGKGELWEMLKEG